MLKNHKFSIFYLIILFLLLHKTSMAILQDTPIPVAVSCPQSSNFKNCLSCEEDLKNCKTCKSGFFNNHNNLPSSGLRLCQDNCQKHCSECTTPDNCTKCESGYFLQLESEQKCQPCQEGCTSCKNENSCTSCSGSYMLNSENQCENIRTKQLLVVGVILIYGLAIAGWCCWQIFTQTKIYKKRQTKKILNEELIVPNKSVYRRETQEKHRKNIEYPGGVIIGRKKSIGSESIERPLSPVQDKCPCSCKQDALRKKDTIEKTGVDDLGEEILNDTE